MNDLANTRLNALRRTQTGSSTSDSAGETVAAQRLRRFIERVERLDEEKSTISADIKEVFAEARAEGYDVKTLKKVIAIRKMDKASRQEAEALLDLYLSTLGES